VGLKVGEIIMIKFLKTVLKLSAIFVFMFSFFTQCAQNEVILSPYLSYFNFSNSSAQCVIKKHPCVLLLRTNRIWGGVSESTFNLFKKLCNLGYNVVILVPRDSRFQEELIKLKCPHYAYKGVRYWKKNFEFRNSFYRVLKLIIELEEIDIIHTQTKGELFAARVVAKNFNIGLVAQYHGSVIDDVKNFRECDLFLGVSPLIVEYLKNDNKRALRNIRHIEFLPPFFDEEKFTHFVPPTQSRIDFFKENFNVTLKDIPTICMVGHLYPCKNHKGILKALKILIDKYKTEAQIVFAGSDTDNQLKNLNLLAKTLNIEDRVFFLGFTKKIPEILFYSDLKVLPSLRDAFPIVILEAAMMKKPIILSRLANAANFFIQNQKTGLLCDPHDYDQIARLIKEVISDKSKSKKFGENAYALVQNNFTTRAILAKLVSLYEQIYVERKVHSEKSKL
jgi:glycosyltransferase involved in cell wall biosynthesis